MTAQEVYVCPKCGSPAVDVSELGVDATCRKCKWEGKVQDLVGTVIQVEGGLGADPKEDMTRMYMKDVRDLVAKEALPFAQLLNKYGFIDKSTVDKKTLSIYLMAIAKAVAITLLETRDRIETGEEGTDATTH